MKLKVTKSAILEGLQLVQNVVSARSTLPILGNVCLTVEKDSLALTGTDLEVSVRCALDAKSTKAGGTTLPARRLLSIMREMPEENIEIEIDEKDVATVKCGASFFKIMGLSEEEFPPIPKFAGKYNYTMEQATLKNMLKRTAYAASSDETRYVLNGVYLSFKGKKLTMVATDGRRLALAENEMDFPKEAEVDIIVPTKAVNQLMHALSDEGQVKIHAQENQVAFEFDGVLVVSKVIDGTYPNYKQVIPSQCEERVTIEREWLLTALKRVSLLTTDRSSSVKLAFGKNRLELTTNTPDVGEARETLTIKFSGKEVAVAFNPEYVMDPLRNLECDEVYIELIDSLSPGVIKCDSPFLYVLMPMRVS